MMASREEINVLRSALIEEVHTHEMALSALRVQINDLSPVSSLPTEVLQMIFFHYAKTFDWNQNSSYNKHKNQILLDLTQVCRRWRSVALGYSEIWFQVTFRSKELGDLFLQRGRSSPLHVSYGRREYSHPILIPSLLRPNSYRIQELRLAHEGPLFFEFTGLEFPNLKVLELDQAGDRTMSIFDLIVPNLDHLSLSTAMIPLIQCTHLTFLKLYNVIGATLLQDVASVLSQCASLQIIDLRGLYSTEESLGVQPNAIKLPNLIEVSLSFEPCIATFVKIIFPWVGCETCFMNLDSRDVSCFSNNQMSDTPLWIISNPHDIEFRASPLIAVISAIYDPPIKVTFQPWDDCIFAYAMPPRISGEAMSRVVNLSMDNLCIKDRLPLNPYLKRFAVLGVEKDDVVQYLKRNLDLYGAAFVLQELRIAYVPAVVISTTEVSQWLQALRSVDEVGGSKWVQIMSFHINETVMLDINTLQDLAESFSEELSIVDYEKTGRHRWELWS